MAMVMGQPANYRFTSISLPVDLVPCVVSKRIRWGRAARHPRFTTPIPLSLASTRTVSLLSLGVQTAAGMATVLTQ